MESAAISQTPLQGAARTPADTGVPLCVDLDGTLIATNLLLEAVLSALRRNPFVVFLLPFWFWRGQAYLWGRVGPSATIDVKTLPYRPEVLRVLRKEHDRGRPLVLVTGAHDALARKLRDHLGLFSRVMATQNGIH